jgi:hypothetical protein
MDQGEVFDREKINKRLLELYNDQAVAGALAGYREKVYDLKCHIEIYIADIGKFVPL